ncbi:MAG: DUF3247 family protein [Rhodanobacter sp.]
MGRHAARIYSDHTRIQQLDSQVAELPANGHVILQLKDGGSCDGVVITRPGRQVLRDDDEREGVNGVVQLERPDVHGWCRTIWLDEILRVEHIDVSVASEN